MQRTPIVIDCDPGQDDAIALFLALASPEALDVGAIVTVAGNVGLARTTANALTIRAAAGRADVPVHAGCPRPILAPPPSAAHVHGESGIDGADLPEVVAQPDPLHGVDALIARARAGDGDLTVVALGPLTNLALAIVKAPDILSRIREIAIMGGAMAGGNVTPVAEFNIHADPEAAAVVFNAGAPIALFGLDVTHQVVATEARVAAIAAIDTVAARAVAGMLRRHLVGPEDDAEGAFLHDPCVIAYLLRPDLFTLSPMTVTIETASPLTRGQTVVERRPEGVANARVATAVDADGFFALLTERLARL